jgi:hypothetical protein
MPWPRNCAACYSFDVQAGIDEIHCLICGRLTDLNGVLVPVSDQFTSEEL